MLIHLGSLDNLSLQEQDNFFDVALADQVCNQVKNFLVDFQGYDSLVLDDGQDIIDVILKNLHVIGPQLEDFLEDDDLDIVVIVLLEKIQVALDCNFDSTWRRRQLCDRIGALE